MICLSCQMLNVAVSGHTSTSYSTASSVVGDLWRDPECENLREIATVPRLSSSDSISSMSSNTDKARPTSPDKGAKKADNDSVKLAARLVCKNHGHNSSFYYCVGIKQYLVCESFFAIHKLLNISHIKFYIMSSLQ